MLSGLKKVLRKGSEKQIIYVLRKIKEMPDSRLFDEVSELIHHASPLVRTEALQCLYFFKSQRIIDKVLPLINDDDQEVKMAAFDYMIAHSPENRIDLFKKYLLDKNYKIRGAALISLAIETRDNPELKDKFELEGRISKRISSLIGLKDPEEIKFRKIVLIKAIGHAKLTTYYSVIDDFLVDEDIDLSNQAILAAGYTMSPDFIDKISPFLNRDSHKECAKIALLNYGPFIVNSFAEKIRTENWNTETLHQIPSIAEKIGTQPSVELLFSFLDHNDISLKMEALRSLNNLKINHPQLRFHHKQVIRRVLDEAHLYLETLVVLYAQITALVSTENILEKQRTSKQLDARKSLVVLLERRLDGNLERIFMLLGLKYPTDDILTIYQGLQSKKPDMRINAVEFLDNLLETSLKRVLVPIFETALLDNISEDTIKNLNLKVPDEAECLSMLLAGKDIKIKLAVLYLISQIGNDKFIPLIEKYINDDNPKVKTFANEAFIALTM